jgi:hypothetical protein
MPNLQKKKHRNQRNRRGRIAVKRSSPLKPSLRLLRGSRNLPRLKRFQMCNLKITMSAVALLISMIYSA